MTRSTQDITFGQASQTLVLDCLDGRPSSVTDVQVWDYSTDDAGTEESATTGSASVETNPNTTVNAASGADEADPTIVYLTATTGCAVDRRYLLTSARGHFEWVEVDDVVSADYIVTRHPLLNNYAVSDTLESTRCSITLDTTWVSDTGNLSTTYNPNPRYRVRWTVVVDSATRVYETAFDLVRYQAQHGVTPQDMVRRHPTWLDSLGPDQRLTQGRDLIERGFEGLKFDLYADNKADQAIRNPEAVDQLVISKTWLMVIEDRVMNGTATGVELEAADRIYRARYDQFLRAPVVQIDTGGGAATTNKPLALLRR
jgi:hypothetical protein